MIHYILQLLAFQLLFLVVYDLFLKKETFFNWNRVYLLFTALLSFVLPLVKIGVIQRSIPGDYVIQLPPVLIGSASPKEVMTSGITINSLDTFFEFLTIVKLGEYIWYVGMLISLFLFCCKLYKIITLKRTGSKTKVEDFSLILLPGTNAAFSFFNTIFLGEELSEVKKANILLHEKTHVKELHSFDLLFFEVLRILCWFNPLVYVYQNRIAVLQEYIADAKAISETNKKEYYQDLLSQIFQTDKISFINTFFNHSLIKNRIVMLQKSKSKKIFQLKYLLLVPVVCFMLVYTSCTKDANAQSDAISEVSNNSLIKKVEAVHEQMLIQGRVTDEEDNALQRFVRVVADGDFSKRGIIQMGKNRTGAQTPLLEKIEAIKLQIEKQGNVTDKEYVALKKLAILVADDGFSVDAFKDVISLIEIPFSMIEKGPIYPGCENLLKEEIKTCFTDKLKQFIVKEVNIKLFEDEGVTGELKVTVDFTINDLGDVVDIEIEGLTGVLEQEAHRVIRSLPKMIPGQQDGVNVGVRFSAPIIARI